MQSGWTGYFTLDLQRIVIIDFKERNEENVLAHADKFSLYLSR